MNHVVHLVVQYGICLRVCYFDKMIFISRLYCYTLGSAIGIILSSVHLFVCPSFHDAVHCGAQSRCRRLKLYHRINRMALPIHFRHCRMYHSAIKHRKITEPTKFLHLGSVVTWSWLLRHFWRFGFAAILQVVQSAFLVTATVLAIDSCSVCGYCEDFIWWCMLPLWLTECLTCIRCHFELTNCRRRSGNSRCWHCATCSHAICKMC